MKSKLALVMLCIFASVIEANVPLETDHNFQIYKKYIEFDTEVRDFVDKNIRRILPYVLEANEELNISSICTDNLFQLMTGFRKLTLWSLKFLDATGKPQSGIISGNLQMFGEHAECFDTEVKNKNKIAFSGQKCYVAIKPVLPDRDYKNEQIKNLTRNSSDLVKTLLKFLHYLYMYDPRIGICVPSGCTKDDISQIFNYVSEKIDINATVLSCIKKEDLAYWTPERIVSVCVFAFLGALLLLGTILDYALEEWQKDKLGFILELIMCFSLTRSFPKLIETNTSEDTITCFYGIRVLSVFWIILCHEFLLHGTALVSNHVVNVEHFVKAFTSQIVLNGFTATEVFFLLGGFVNCYARVKLHRSGKFQPNFFQIMLHRLWRIYPTLIVTYLVHFLLNYTSTPYYHTVLQNEEVCRKEWWKNFIFINNFFKPFSVCIPHTWYLCADMQMFLLSLFTIPVLLKKEKIGIYLHIGVIILSNIACFLLWWIEDLPPSPLTIPVDDLSRVSISYFEHHAKIYMLPILHIASYYIGILSGYVVAAKKKKIFSKRVWILGWLAASFFYITTIFLTYRWNSGIPYTKFESSLFGSLSKSVLVSCIAWMIYCCYTGQARFFNYILSLKIWVPLSRMTYMIYMISIMVQFYYNFNLNYPPDFANIFLVWNYFGDLSISLLLSLLLVLLAESPMLALEKVLFRKKRNENECITEFQKELTVNGIKENNFNGNDNDAIVHL